MVGLGGLTGLISFLIFSMRVNLEFYLIMTVIAAGLAGTSRLFLDAHRPSQLYAGFVLGLLTIPAVMWVYLAFPFLPVQ
ncbi:MAG: phosphatase PAP2 family protein [Deltaproteobacteria bacterium]|nr:phosphatase PAP2 family protein [Deltaproteobacteria bacterium]